MSEEKATPANGHLIELTPGQLVTVHCDCKDVRDELEKYFRLLAIQALDMALAEKLITKEKHAEQFDKTLMEFRRGDYRFGKNTFADMRTTLDEGITYDLFTRIKLNHPQVTIEQVKAWMERQQTLLNEDQTQVVQDRWSRARIAMAIADGFAPKSYTPAGGTVSAGVSSKNTPEQSLTKDCPDLAITT